ncbi:Piso0_002407 [Millerozyma farinosa CBS 7064]|uniref:Apurinic-apyrimidinic endonuclease 1 n=1 Tax=Pichia sorbitophila (strain ATCC MYA-4447 / BCRC 22081 / CBS 7064 / NBRC 10061 / NRRL Y-12695) TaxID=559304 RepID=G8YEZ2_PICSO|nr:Piso0_002407 [Millerozyma farinosa CBS 7064]
MIHIGRAISTSLIPVKIQVLVKQITKRVGYRTMAKKSAANGAKAFKYERNRETPFKFGAHVGMSGGISNAVLNAMDIGANSFALFLKSPRKWVSPDIKDEEAEKFKNLCHTYGYNTRTDILPHGSYFINLANPDKEKEEKAFGSFLDDLKRCEKLDIGLYNFHPGSRLDGDHDEALARLAKNINRAIKETSFVKIVIENMAGHGNLIGSELQDIRKVIDMVEDKNRVGVCIDTCHSFAAGYDVSTEEGFAKFWKLFEETIGWEYLSAIHLNDSKAPLGDNRDLHQKLGYGFMGLEPFLIIANNKKLQNIPVVLETPVQNDDSVYGEEIKLLEWLEGKSLDDSSYLAKKDELAKLGEKERAEQLKKSQAKASKKSKVSKKRQAGNILEATIIKKIK